MWWGAINRSLVIGFVIVVLVAAFNSCEPLMDYFDSHDTPFESPMTDVESSQQIVRKLMLLPVVHLVASGVAFLFHLPFLLLIEFFNRVRPT
jgi:hypothetical protein